MRDKAFAKINLCLEVGPTRSDGYHDLRMVMIPVDFFDVVELEVAEKDELIANRNFIPLNENNTMYKALSLLRKKYGFNECFRMKLQKQIPVRAGLAGGSADAASIIRLVNRLLGLKMSRQEMIDVALEVGSDVPFCLFNEPCVVEGKGEILSPIEVNLDFHLLLAKPKAGVSTKVAFQNMREEDKAPIQIEELVRSLKNGEYSVFLNHLGNHLEPSAIRLVPKIKMLKQELWDLGFDGVLMSGSGSTVFAVTRNPELCTKGFEVLRKKGYFVRKTKIRR